MIVCTKCGTENPEGIHFCQKCGGYLDWSGVKVAVQEGSAVSASLKSPDVTVDPGNQAVCEVEVHNDGRLVDEYRLQVSGVDPSWCSVEPTSLRLMPKTSASARILFRPPHMSNPAAGTGPFVVVVSSSVDPSVQSQVAGSLTIRPFADVSAAITPQTSESLKVAEDTVSVENRGNAAIRVALTRRTPTTSARGELVVQVATGDSRGRLADGGRRRGCGRRAAIPALAAATAIFPIADCRQAQCQSANRQFWHGAGGGGKRSDFDHDWEQRRLQIDDFAEVE